MTSFQEKVYTATRRVPKGRVSTYTAIARAIGSPRAVRAVGNALNKNPDIKYTPCHRIVRSDGSIGGYACGSARKAVILKKEGVIVRDGKVDLKRYEKK